MTTSWDDNSDVHPAGVTAVTVAMGAYHTCLILVEGTIKCWGLNGNGNLGIGNKINQLRPTTVDLGSGGPWVHKMSALDQSEILGTEWNCWNNALF